LQSDERWGFADNRSLLDCDASQLDLDLSWADSTMEKEALEEIFAKHS